METKEKKDHMILAGRWGQAKMQSRAFKVVQKAHGRQNTVADLHFKIPTSKKAFYFLTRSDHVLSCWACCPLCYLER